MRMVAAMWDPGAMSWSRGRGHGVEVEWKVMGLLAMGAGAMGGSGGGGERAERAGMHWGPLKSSDRVHGRHALGPFKVI